MIIIIIKDSSKQSEMILVSIRILFSHKNFILWLHYWIFFPVAPSLRILSSSSSSTISFIWEKKTFNKFWMKNLTRIYKRKFLIIIIIIIIVIKIFHILNRRNAIIFPSNYITFYKTNKQNQIILLKRIISKKKNDQNQNIGYLLHLSLALSISESLSRYMTHT